MSCCLEIFLCYGYFPHIRYVFPVCKYNTCSPDPTSSSYSCFFSTARPISVRFFPKNLLVRILLPFSNFHFFHWLWVLPLLSCANLVQLFITIPISCAALELQPAVVNSFFDYFPSGIQRAFELELLGKLVHCTTPGIPPRKCNKFANVLTAFELSGRVIRVQNIYFNFPLNHFSSFLHHNRWWGGQGKCYETHGNVFPLAYCVTKKYPLITIAYNCFV